MPHMKRKIQRKTILTGGSILAVFILLFGAFSQAGFVFAGPYLITKGGTLLIEQARPQSNVFIDNRQVGIVDAQGKATFARIKPGKRNIIVSNESAWPWTFEFVSISSESITLEPLQVNVKTDGEVITDTENPLNSIAIEAFKNYQPPTQANPLERSTRKIWVVGSNIFMQQENGEVINIYASQNTIRNIFWYGDRDGILIIASLNNVFALDVREIPVKNFQPIYTGSAPEAVDDESTYDKIFIHDADGYLYITI